MRRKTNFSHIPVRGDTKEQVDKLKEQLAKCYNETTYDEIVRILLEKHRKLKLSDSDVKRIVGKMRGIKIWEI